MKSIKNLGQKAALCAAFTTVATVGMAGQAAAERGNYTAKLSAVYTSVAGQTYLSFQGLNDEETSDSADGAVNVTTPTSYQCDRAGADLDLPYIDMTLQNADASVSVALAAFLSGREVVASWGNDCRISIMRIR